MSSTPTTVTDNTTHAMAETSICSEAFPEAVKYFNGLKELPALLTFVCIAIVLSVLTILLYVTEVFYQDYKLLKEPGKRRQILVLQFIYPMTSAMAMFAIIVPKSTVLADLLAACYLSFCLYVFIRALIFYYGDSDKMVEAFGTHEISIRTPPCCCCCCCFPQIRLTRRSLFVLKCIVMQVAVLQPLVLFLKAVVWANDNDSVNDSGWDAPFLYFNILIGASTLFAMYGLTIMVRASESKGDLEKHRIKVKFVVLQLVLVITGIQNLIFTILIRFELPPCELFYGVRVKASIINHIIIIFEMFLLAIVARRVYHTSEHSNLEITIENGTVDYDRDENGTVDYDKDDNSTSEERSSSLNKQ